MNPGPPESRDDLEVLRKAPDFSLVLGGPLFQLLRRAHFWARGYFVSTVGRDEQVIREYIRNQGRIQPVDATH